MRWSAECFKNTVWPAIAAHVGGGQIIPVEEMTGDDNMRRLLDVNAGIDAWWVRANGDMSGIASRVQKPNAAWVGQYPFNTFTVRAALASGNETELHKRRRAIEKSDYGILYPHLTVQAYMDASTQMVMSVAVIRTRDLIDAVDRYSWDRRVVAGGNTMVVVEWEVLDALGYDVRIITHEELS